MITPHSVATEFPDSVRLRIMCEIEELDDLHATAMVNRAYFETYKKHELFLMRNILRMDRRRAGNRRQAIPSNITNAEEKVLKIESDELKTTVGGETDGLTLRSDEDDEDYSDSDDDTSIYSSSLAPSIQRSAGRDSFSRGTDHQRSADSVSIRTGSPTRADRTPTDTPTAWSNSPGSPTTPRQSPIDPPPPQATATSPVQPSAVVTQEIDEPPLTVEEANRILWPESAIKAVAAASVNPLSGVEGQREKFRVGDPALAEGLEEKTLVPTGEKQLRSEHDRRVGLLKGKGDPSDENGVGK